MSSLAKKEKLRDLVLADLQRLLDQADAEEKREIHESKQHKGAMASRYDTFKEEAQAMMAAQQLRKATISNEMGLVSQVGIRECKKLAIGALFRLKDGDDQQAYFLLPGGGGNSYDIDGETITILSSTAPLAVQLLSAEDEEVEIRRGKATRLVTICLIE
jgi:hypothetical protein